MPTRAGAYVGGVLGAGFLLSVLALLRFAPTPAIWAPFATLTILATLAQLYKAEAPNHVLFHPGKVFFFAGVLLLPPFLLLLLPAIPHVIEWGKERWRRSPRLRTWYVQPFNIAMNGFIGLAIYWLYGALTVERVGGATAAPAIAGLAAALSYVCLSHLLLGLFLILTRGVSWRDSGMLELSALLTGLALACVGLVVATLWQIHPLFIVPALAPLVLMYQVLMIPHRERKAEIESVATQLPASSDLPSEGGAWAVAAIGPAPTQTKEGRPDGGADGTDHEQPASSKRVVGIGPRAMRLFPQPGVAVAIVLLAVVSLIAALRSSGLSLGSEPLGMTLEAMILAGTIVMAYQYPIHIRLHLKVQVSTMIYYLIAAVLPLPLAVGAAGIGTLLGEVSVRQQRKLYPSDIATAVGRWMLLVLLGNLVSHVSASTDAALGLLVACALVLGLGDLVTLPLILASMTRERPLHMLRALAIETGPSDGVQYLIGFLGVLVSQRAGWALALLVVPAALIYQSAKHLHEVRDSTHMLLESMADTVDLRDSYTGGHSRRVTEYCGQILRELKLSGPDRELILSAARVHDIGKIALPDAILNKPGPLTAEERTLMQTHPARGAEVLARHKDFIRGVAIVLHHHEAWDGSGYPHGLKGVEIPFGARVMAIADSFDAMTSDRPYRRGFSVAKAAGILREGRGQQWDPQVIDAFLRSIAVQLESQQRPLLQVVPSTPEPSTPALGA